MNQPAAARANQQPAVQQRVFYLAMDDLYESQIAKAWAKKHGDKDLVFFIPIERLTSEMVIVPVVRDAESRTPLIQEEFDAQERKMKQKRVTPGELADEMHECKPVRVAEYWRTSGGRGGSGVFSEMLMGSVDHNAFINAVGESVLNCSVYARTHHGDDNKTLKLTWGS